MLSAFPAAAERHHVAVVAPEAVGGSWNVGADGPDDARFVRDAIDGIARRFPVDPGRVFATGFSAGARFLCVRASGLGHQ